MNRPRCAARYHLALVLLASCALATAPGCSDTSSGPASSGPAADVSEELTAGGGPFIGESTAANLDAAGYVQHEYVAAGTAVSYRATEPLTGDGRWSFTGLEDPAVVAVFKAVKEGATADKPKAPAAKKEGAKPASAKRSTRSRRKAAPEVEDEEFVEDDELDLD